MSSVQVLLLRFLLTVPDREPTPTPHFLWINRPPITSSLILGIPPPPCSAPPGFVPYPHPRVPWWHPSPHFPAPILRRRTIRAIPQNRAKHPYPPPFPGGGGCRSNLFGAWGPPTPTTRPCPPYPHPRYPWGHSPPVFRRCFTPETVFVQVFFWAYEGGSTRGADGLCLPPHPLQGEGGAPEVGRGGITFFRHYHPIGSLSHCQEPAAVHPCPQWMHVFCLRLTPMLSFSPSCEVKFPKKGNIYRSVTYSMVIPKTSSPNE
jgi:hypothetical protein